MRNMSFSMTTEAVRRREKTVTRRLGWWGLKPGDELVSVRREQLDNIYAYERETAAEGFPELTPGAFMAMFCKANACETWRMINRIEFEYLP